MNDEFERAKEVYLEAIGVSADCLEAIYNLGLVNMHIGHPVDECPFGARGQGVGFAL